MEKYLRACLQSLIIENSDLQKQLEVLVVNDGSKDNSLEIAEEFSKLNPDVFRVIDKKNGNYGSCVNRGLKEATGKYVKILDADDSFDSNGLRELVIVLSNVDVDMLLSDYVTVREDGTVTGNYKFQIPSNTILRAADYIDCFNRIQMHAVVYRLENLRKINYIQTEGISYTDQEWVFIPLTTIRTFYYLDTVVYKYLVGRSGQTVELGTYHKRVSDRVKMVRNIVALFVQFKNDNKSGIYDSFLTKRATELIHSIYLSYVIVNRDSAGAGDFDNFLKTSSTELYGLCDNLIVYKFLPFKYIAYWRTRGMLPPKLLSNAYRWLKSIR